MTVARREYRPGSGWTLLARGELTVLVPAAQPDEFLGRLWDALGADGADLYALLDVFASAFGLARMPAFALAEHGDRLRLLVRGAVRASVTTPSGDEALSGSEVGTWLERAFEAWDTVEVSGAPAGAVDAEEPRGALPLLGGVVAADTVLVAAERGTGAAGTDDAGTDDAASAPDAVSSPAAVVPLAAAVPPDAVVAPVTAAVPATASEETLLPESTVAPVSPADSTLAAPGSGEPQRADFETAQHDEAPAGAAPVVAEEAPETTSSTSDYDHLWGTTVLRSVEDAAVRTDGGEDEEPRGGELDARESSAGEPDAAGPDAGEPDAGEPDATGPDAGEPDAGEPDAPAGRAPSDAGNGRGPAAWSPPSLLIDAVPWAKPQQAPPTQAPAREPGDQSQPRPRPRAQSEMNYPDPPQDGAGSGNAPQGRSITSELYGDHDGETVMRSELDPASLGAEPDQGLAASGAPGQARGAAAPLVLGRRCTQGHASPPSYPQCAVCGEHLDGETVQVPRPALGRVVFSTGEVIDLVQPLVVGRQPSVSRVPSGGMPRLVSVTSPSGDISRNHLEVRLEGWHVMVRDLKATNGTVLERPGQAPRRLAQGEMTIVLDGDVADLGDGVSLRFEAVP